MDSKLSGVKKWIEDEGHSTAIAPAHMVDEFKAGMPLETVHSYAIAREELPNIDAVVLHKGFMHRLDPAIGMAILTEWDLGYANDVFCCYSRKLQEPGRSEKFKAHVGPVVTWLKEVHPELGRPFGKRIESAVIASAYGAGNVGDDLVTLATEHVLRRAGVKEVLCSGPFVKFDHLLKHEAVVLGGGGILYDTDDRNLENYMWPLRVGARMGKLTAVLGAGTQGYVTDVGRAAAAQSLRAAGHVSVRSAQDVSILTQIDPALEGHVERGTDLGFYMGPYLREHANPAADTHGPVVVSLSSTSTDPALGEVPMEKVLDDVLADLLAKGHQVIIGLQSEDDRPMYKRMADKYPRVKYIDLSAMGPVAAASVYAAAGSVITSRFHGLIYACIFDKPVIAINRGECKIHRLIHGEIPSLLQQLVTAKDIDGSVVLKAFENVGAPSRAEVADCEKRAEQMAQSLISYIQQA